MKNKTCDNQRRTMLKDSLSLAGGLGIFGAFGTEALAQTPQKTKEQGEKMPTRFEKGMQQLQKIDGEAGQKVIDSLAPIAPDLGKHIVEFAFGDIYTRGELDLKERELITLASLLTAGGCEAQLGVHINAALNVGIAPAKIIESFLQCVPYTGFPKVLNAVFVAKKIFETKGLSALT